MKQLGQSNGPVTDGPAACDKLPSTAAQRSRPSCQEFSFGNDWADTLKCAMRHGWATKTELCQRQISPL